MSLFKKSILSCYNLMHYTEKGFLLLHCSRNDVVYAPFSGIVEATEDGCILYNDKYKLYICHMVCDKSQEVSAGDRIGTPILERDMAYIGIKLYKDDEYQNPTMYLDHMDKDEVKEVKQEVKETAEVQTKTKKKSNRKKK